jgi:hypothetical protein
MAEVVNERIEDMLPELEQMERVKLFNKHEIRYRFYHLILVESQYLCSTSPVLDQYFYLCTIYAKKWKNPGKLFVLFVPDL